MKTTSADTGTDIQLCDEPNQRFSTRVAVGTLIGIMTCLVFAALLMMISLLRPSSIQNSLTGDSGARRTGTGDKSGAGTSSDADKDGDSNQNVAGDNAPTGSASAGRDGSETVSHAKSEESGSADSTTAQKDSPETDGTGTVIAKKNTYQRSFTITPIEELQLDRAEDDGIRNPAAARAPGMFAGRDPEARSELAKSEGGSEASEAAVENGLKWLAKHQEKDGHWSLEQFHATGECNGRCSMPGGVASDAAGTGFGLLPFLGAGYTHQSGKYKISVKAGLDWLIDDQTKDGTFLHCESGTLYAHGIASIAMCEAYAMTKDQRLKEPAQRSIDYIVKAQHDRGGWRYCPGEPGDTSVTGWQVIALRSAQQGGLRSPKNVMTRLSTYLDSVQLDKEGSGYRYMPGDRVTDAMIAEGLLCRIYSSWNSKRPGLEAGTQYLLAHPPQIGGELYYWYYATQVIHHYGGDPWQTWNPRMRELLIDLQSTNGHESGSWAPSGGHDNAGGRLYATSLALLTLEVYYRHKRVY